MSKEYFYRSFVYVLVFSLLNMQFSSVAYGMRQEGGTASVDEAYMDKTGKSAIRLSELRKTDLTQPILDQQSGNISTSHALLTTEEIKDSFKPVLRSFMEKIYTNEDRSTQTRWIILGVAGIWAGFASLAILSLFMEDGSTLSFLEYPVDDDASVTVPPITTTEYVIGSVAGALVLPDLLSLASHALKGGYAPFKNHRSIEEQDPLKRIVFYTLAAPTVAILMAQLLYAYITNVVGAEGDAVYVLYDRGLQIAPAVPFFSLQLLKDYRSFSVNYRLLYESSRKKIDKIRGIKREGEEDKSAIRVRLAHGMRKLLKEPDQTETLSLTIEKLFEKTRTERHAIKEKLTALRTIQSPEVISVHQQQITALEAQLEDLEAQTTLKLFKLLYTFDQEEEYKAGKSHPWWYYGAGMTGIALGGLASETNWYGNVLIANDSLGASYTQSYRLGTLASFVAVPYLMDRGRFWLEGLTSLIHRYNPVENERTIRSPVVDFSKLHLTMNLLNMAKCTYLMIPATMVGGGAMFTGVGPGAPSILWKNQLQTIIPSLLAWGAAENKNTGPRHMESISQAAQHFGIHHEATTKRQEVANWFHRADKWVEKLAGHHVPELKELLDKKHEDIEAGKVSAGEHSDGSRSTDSPSSDERKSSDEVHKGSPESTSSAEGVTSGEGLDSVRKTLTYKGAEGQDPGRSEHKGEFTINPLVAAQKGHDPSTRLTSDDKL